MKKLTLMAFVFVSAVSHADDIRLGQPATGGTGCPQGTVSASLTSDQKSLSILFDQYAAEAGRTTGRTVDRKTCDIAIPVHVPQGLSISLVAVDYRGFNAIPSGGSTRLSVDYFFAGQKGPHYQKNFSGPQNQDFLASNSLEVSAMAWSPCGADTNLRVNSSIMAQTNSRNDQTIAQIDSADIKAGIVYHVQWRSCR